MKTGLKSSMKKPEVKQPPVQVLDPFIWKIPECCHEGWASCPHVPKKQRKVKRNIAL